MSTVGKPQSMVGSRVHPPWPLATIGTVDRSYTSSTLFSTLSSSRQCRLAVATAAGR